MTLWLLIAGVHLLMILWLIGRPSDHRAKPVGSSAMVLVAVSEAGRSAPPARQPVPAAPAAGQLPLPPIPLLLPSVMRAEAVSGAPAASDAAAFGGCDLAKQVETAIRQDPPAMADLAALPPGSRTEADAVMLWNGVWLGAPATPIPAPAHTTPIANLQSVVLALVSAAPPECRDAAMIGPVFMAIPESGRTTTVVIGSGIWRWADLLPPAEGTPPGKITAPLG